jgi:diaminopimelate epimerase/ribosomal protein S18 acetylase RimI-like enzyme
MQPTEIAAGQFEIASITDLATLDQPTWQSAINTYRQAFAGEPYNEAFSSGEAETALSNILEQGGDLFIGMLGDMTVSLAGGYSKPDGTYFIEELAVSPDEQGNGYGRLTLDALLEAAQRRNPERYEIRTTKRNTKAISLYESEGFVSELGTEIVAQSRQDGGIGLDERVYLSKPPLPERERLTALKRVAVAYPSGNTTAVVFDQLLDSDRKKLNDRVMSAWKDRRPDQTEIEQCCFVTRANSPEAVARVEMFGGEFCGNAMRSVAWLVTKGQDYSGLIEVSGVNRPLAFSVERGDVVVEMPLPETCERKLVQPIDEGSLVQLDGTTQLVVTEPMNGQTPRQLLATLLGSNKYRLTGQPSVGVSYYDRTSGKAEFCVWVKEVDTIFDETACGSGTCAIGVASATKAKGSISLSVVQPSGESIATVATYQDGSVTKSFIAGKVDILYDGELKLP